MGTYDKELYRQSSFTLGVSDSKRTRATITALVKDLSDARSALRTATLDGFNEHGYFHPDDAQLPLQTVQSVFVPPNKSLVVLNYGYDPDTFATGTISIFDLPDLDVGMVGITRYKAINGTAAEDAYVKTEPILMLYAGGSGTAGPLSNVFSRVGKTNSDTVTWAGHSIPPNVVRFDGFKQRAAVVEGVPDVRWTYQFTMLPAEWIVYFPSTASATEGSANMYGSASFSGQFPTSL